MTNLLSETLIIFIFIAIWLITFVLMWGIKNNFIPGIGGVVGIALSLRLISSVDNILGGIVMIVSFYQLYLAVFAEEGRKRG